MVHKSKRVMSLKEMTKDIGMSLRKHLQLQLRDRVRPRKERETISYYALKKAMMSLKMLMWITQSQAMNRMLV